MYFHVLFSHLLTFQLLYYLWVKCKTVNMNYYQGTRTWVKCLCYACKRAAKARALKQNLCVIKQFHPLILETMIYIYIIPAPWNKKAGQMMTTDTSRSIFRLSYDDKSGPSQLKRLLLPPFLTVAFNESNSHLLLNKQK